MDTARTADAQARIDQANAQFWDELCGTGLAKHLGIVTRTEASLQRFDAYYFGLYPYLLDRVPVDRFRGKRVLEIGLGYGTLGQRIAESGADYVGLDIADGPVRMMNQRLQMKGLQGSAQQGNMLTCPFPNDAFDCVVSIGCFHHTGDTQRCFDETWRVLRPGGEAYLMVYNQFSYRQWLRWPAATWKAFLAERGLSTPEATVSEAARKAYDADGSGHGAPETEFFSVRRLQRMLRQFASVHVKKENCDGIVRRGRTLISRGALLPTLGQYWGLDLYVRVVK